MPGGNNSFWWANRQPWRPTAQGGPQAGGGGYGSEYTVTPGQYRDPLDAARSGAFGAGRIGQATYPDGYLQPSNSRRQDAPASVYRRLDDRSYLRGINAGVKMDMLHYFWPAELDPARGLQHEAAARRHGSVLLCRRTVPYGRREDRLMHSPALDQLAGDTRAAPRKTYAGRDWTPATLW
jgi:hypothetical protein